MKSAGKVLMCRFRTFFLAVCVLLIFNGICIAASGGEEYVTKGWVATDTYRVINFAILAFALIFIFQKYGSGFLNGRIKEIRNHLHDLESKKKDAEIKLSELQAKLSTLTNESEKILNEYVKQGEESKIRILQEAENATVKIEEQAKRNIQYEFKLAKQKLQEEVIEKAIAKAEQIVRDSISGEDQERIIDEYLKKVVA